MPKKESGKRNIVLLGLVSLLNDSSSKMIEPILPLFITALGGAGISIGFIGGLRDSIASILQVLSGWWSDRIGRRKIFVSFGYFFSAIFKLALAVSRSWPLIFLFASIERLGKGIRTAPRDAILSSSMPKKHGLGFGIHRTFDTGGAIIGALLVFLLFWFWGFGFRTLILIAAVIAFASLIPLIFVREHRNAKKENKLRISLRLLPPNLRKFIIVAGIFALANFSYMFFILKASASFEDKYAIAIPILLYLLFSIFYAGFAIPFGKLSDRIGRKKVLIGGYSLFTITCLGFAFFDSITAFIVLFILYGLLFAMVNANQRAYVSDLSPKKITATSLGTFHTVIGLAALPASVIAGILWQINIFFTFIFGAVVSAVSVIAFLALRVTHKKKS